jgi:putative membrane protein
MASAALGLGFHAVVQKLEPTWLAKTGASLFILIGIGILAIAQANAKKVSERLDTHGVHALRQSRYASSRWRWRRRVLSFWLLSGC